VPHQAACVVLPSRRIRQVFVDRANHIPQGGLVVESQARRPVIKNAIKKDQPITWDDIEIFENRMTDLWKKQTPLVGLT
jgi:hypothetical protein